MYIFRAEYGCSTADVNALNKYHTQLVFFFFFGRPETVKQLLDYILGKEKSESSIVGGISVLLTLLDLSKPR